MTTKDYDNHFQLVTDHFGENDSFNGYEPENSFFDGFDQEEALGYDKETPDNLFGFGKKKKRRAQRAELLRQQQEAAQQLAQQAQSMGTSIPVAALANVQQNAPLVSEWVQRNGMQPQENPAALALQATQAFQNRIEEKQQSGIPDYDSAHDSVINDAQDEWGEPADEFFGAILTSVFAAGKALLNKINEKRLAKGKKPLFAGKNWQKLGEKVVANEPIVMDALSSTERAFLALTKKQAYDADPQGAAAAAAAAFANDQKKQAFMAYLPYILIGIVVIYFVAKKV